MVVSCIGSIDARAGVNAQHDGLARILAT